MEQLEHPDITRIERDGYAEAPKVACACSMCEQPIYYHERALHVPGYGWICENCTCDYMEEVLFIDDI